PASPSSNLVPWPHAAESPAFGILPKNRQRQTAPAPAASVPALCRSALTSQVPAPADLIHFEADSKMRRWFQWQVALRELSSPEPEPQQQGFVSGMMQSLHR